MFRALSPNSERATSDALQLLYQQLFGRLSVRPSQQQGSFGAEHVRGQRVPEASRLLVVQVRKLPAAHRIHVCRRRHGEAPIRTAVERLRLYGRPLVDEG